MTTDERLARIEAKLDALASRLDTIDDDASRLAYEVEDLKDDVTALIKTVNAMVLNWPRKR